MKIKTFLVYCAISILVFTPVYLSGAENRQTVAVAAFETDNASNPDAGLVQENVTSYIVRSNSYTVIEKSQLVRVLGELRFTNADLADSAKAVKAGKLLSAYGIVIGSITHQGTTTTIVAKLIGTDRGRIVRMSKIEIVSPGSLDDACKVVAYELVNRHSEVAALRKKIEDENQGTGATGEPEKSSKFWVGIKLGFGLSWFGNSSPSTSSEKSTANLMGEINLQILYYFSKAFAVKFDTGYSRNKGNIGTPLVVYDLYSIQALALLDFNGISFFAGFNVGFKIKGYSNDNPGNYTYDFGNALGFTIGAGYSFTFRRIKLSIMAEFRMTFNKPISRYLSGEGTEDYRQSIFGLNVTLLFGL